MNESQRSEINSLRTFSAQIGRNPLLVQASSGNTSVKLDETLWIKASGKWLVNAGREDFLAAVNLADIQQSIRQANAVQMSYQTPAGEMLHASIETTMHAVLPYPVVVHVHSVNTIAWAVRSDAVAQLTSRFAGLPWQWISYTPSGIPLAQAIEKALSVRPETNIFVLGNHGLVLCGHSCSAVSALLDEVEGRLHRSPRSAPATDIRALEPWLTDPSQWTLPSNGMVHALATDLTARRILAGGVLYPCQAVFLNASIPVRHHLHEAETNDSFVVLGERGVLCRPSISRAELEMLVGLAEILLRIDEDAPIRYLTALELAYLLDNDALQYRALAERNCEMQPALR